MEKNDNNRQLILMSLLERPFTISELSKNLKLSRPTIYLHLANLEKKGFIKREKDNKKKGAPVTIYRVEKNISIARKKEIIKLLKTLSENELDIKELHDKGYGFPNTISQEAQFMGYISKKVYLTDEGKKFLKENE